MDMEDFSEDIIENKRIIYKAKISELKENLRELKNLNMKVDNFDDKVIGIERKVEESEKNYSNQTNSIDANNSIVISTDIIYEEAIKQIKEISDYIINTYNAYYQIQAKTAKLNSRIKKLDLSNIDDLVLFDDSVNDAIELLNSLKSTTNIDHESEESIVSGVYELVYEIIKLENIIDGYKLLGTVKNNEVDTIYVSRIVKKEIDDICNNAKIDTNNTNLKMMVEKINSNGFETKYYLDKDLITLLIFINNPDMITEEFTKKIDDYRNYLERVESLELELDDYSKTYDELKNEKAELTKKRRGAYLNITINIATLLGSAFLGGFVLKNFFSDKTYKTVTEVYNSSFDSEDDIVTSTEYLEKKDNLETVNITVYSPWQYSSIFNNYNRNVSQYEIDTSKYSYDDLSMYLEVNPTDIVHLSDYQESVYMPLSDDYESKEYVITKTTQDLEEYTVSENKTWIVLTLLFVLARLLDIKIDTKKKYGKYFKKNNLTKQMNELKEKMLEIVSETGKLYKELDEIKQEINKRYNLLPDYIKENEEISKKMLVLKKDTKED